MCGTISIWILCDYKYHSLVWSTMQLPPGETLIRARDNLTHVQPQVFPKLTMHTLLWPYFKTSALPCFEPPTEILDTLYWCALNIHLSFSLVRSRVHSLTPPLQPLVPDHAHTSMYRLMVKYRDSSDNEVFPFLIITVEPY